ncbi:MAG TPA: GNAT family N-acyltransferase [Candidatus Acidoferrales bacterium]|nr:GNAT family N-acyltransferase [Candidatus Acidoferrales bacterium]
MQTETIREPLSVFGLLNEPLRSMLTPMQPAIQKLFAFDRLQRVFDAARRAGHGTEPVARVLELLGITWHVDPVDLQYIPRCGPVVAIANHPFGLLEGAILATLLPRIRPDVRILANSILANIPELREKCIFINPFGSHKSVSSNADALRQCLAWLRGGGLLVAFPAGEVAHLDFRNGTLADPPWNRSVAWLAQLSGAAVLPIFFKGANSMAFQLAGLVHPGLRTASLPRELLNKRGWNVEIRIGRPVSQATLQAFPDSRETIKYLRCRTHLLDIGVFNTRQVNNAGRVSPGCGITAVRVFQAFKKLAPVVSQLPQREMTREIDRLAPYQKLCAAGDLAVYLASAGELPNVLREIGRLREIAFRGAGEGTGHAFDLDRFDRHYLHLVLWNQSREEVVGGYRLGPTTAILPRYGVAGLYTSTLFRYSNDLFDRIGPAVELGRSFVRPEYQRQYTPLLLLWKGIGRYVAGNPRCSALFGAVSISNRYHPVSRQLLVKFLEAHRASGLAPMVTPRHPYRPDAQVFRRTGQTPHVRDDVEQLSLLIEDLESDRKGIPILVKQYLRTGGELLAFNVDSGFSGVLDALIMVDLKGAPPALLERVMGKPGAATFTAWHAKC